MKYEIGTFKRSNWITVTLLTIVMVGFGLFAEAHVATNSSGEPAIARSQLQVTPIAGDTLAGELFHNFF
ncbi:MAG: hypothetical protein WD002_06750 [Pseudomonadales bacterium]